MNPAVTIRITRFLLLVLFFYTGISKLFQHEVFESGFLIHTFHQNGAASLSYIIPLSELTVALLLFFRQTERYGLYASLVLLILFTVYLVVMLLFATNLPCHCGGVISQLSWKQHVFFNLFFIGMNVLALAALRKQEQVMNDIQY